MKNGLTSDGGEQNLREVFKNIQHVYESIVLWKKNLFILLTSAAAERTKLMNGWTNNRPFNDITFQAVHIMPSLPLQKLSRHLNRNYPIKWID